jgi:hypothetical protein
MSDHGWSGYFVRMLAVAGRGQRGLAYLTEGLLPAPMMTVGLSGGCGCWRWGAQVLSAFGG